MEESRLFALRANKDELAKIKAIKKEKGIKSDAELIRILLNDEAKKILL